MNTGDRRVAVVVRETGERTAQACRELLAAQLPDAPMKTVGGRPFPETLAASLRAGVEAACEWTLCVDADVLPLPGGVAALLAETAEIPMTLIELQPVVFDRFFGGWRPAGVHLYRTRHLPQALAVLARMSDSIRPETALLQQLAVEGIEWRQSTVEFGVHDFEQWPHDIFRKCFVHAHKHSELGTALECYWTARVAEPDFAEALRGFAAGRSHAGAIALDASAPYLQASMGPAADELTEAPDVGAMLESEEVAVCAIFPDGAPVWDFIQSTWALEHSRRATIDAFVRRMLKAGGRPCVIERGDARTRILLQRAAALNVPVIGVVDAALAGRNRFHGASIFAGQPAAQDGTMRVGRGSDGRFVGCGPEGVVVEPEPGQLKAGPGPRPRAEQVRELIERIGAIGVRRILVYGAGEAGAEVARAATGRIELVAFVESEAGQRQAPAPVLLPKQAVALHGGMDLVIASQSFALEMMRRWFISAAEAGIHPGRIWMLPQV